MLMAQNKFFTKPFSMNIKQLKKELQLSNTKIAEFFDLTPMVFANSTAKERYENAFCRFYVYLMLSGKIKQ